MEMKVKGLFKVGQHNMNGNLYEVESLKKAAARLEKSPVPVYAGDIGRRRDDKGGHVGFASKMTVVEGEVPIVTITVTSEFHNYLPASPAKIAFSTRSICPKVTRVGDLKHSTIGLIEGINIGPMNPIEIIKAKEMELGEY